MTDTHNDSHSASHSNPHNNVDPQEVAKFNAIANRWWDRDSEFKPLHDINPLRLNFIDSISPLNGKRVLDVGCGGGILSESMAQRGAKVTGIDMGETPINVAKLHSLESGTQVDYRQTSIEVLLEELGDDPANHFDTITCLEMLEHVPDPASVIASCSKLLKPGGHLFMSTINRNPKSYLFAVVGAEYVLNMLPRGTHDYSKFIRPAELADWARQAGLSVGKITGMTYNPLTRHYKLNDQDVDVNYLMHSHKPA